MRKKAKKADREMDVTVDKSRTATGGDDTESVVPVEAAVLPWLTVIFIMGVALVFWFTVHLVGAAIFQSLEPKLGNLADLTPNSFGNVLYYTLLSSNTICFGTDYNAKTQEGRAFFLFWHQIGMMAGTFLFVAATLAVLKYLDAKLFWLVGKVTYKIKKSTGGSTSESESESEITTSDEES